MKTFTKIALITTGLTLASLTQAEYKLSGETAIGKTTCYIFTNNKFSSKTQCSYVGNDGVYYDQTGTIATSEYWFNYKMPKSTIKVSDIHTYKPSTDSKKVTIINRKTTINGKTGTLQYRWRKNYQVFTEQQMANLPEEKPGEWGNVLTCIKANDNSLEVCSYIEMPV